MTTTTGATPAPVPPLSWDLRIRFSVMMFLQFAIWGAWYVLLANYLSEYGFADIGSIFGTMAIGAMISPILIGQLADRFFSTEKILGVLHLAGAALLYWMANSLESQTAFYWITLCYAITYNPTIALTNSICFAHVPNATRDFPGIRVLGTIGWIVVNVSYLVLVTEGQQIGTLPLNLASGLSLLMGLFCFFLPHTPPTGKTGEALPFLGALGLFKDFSFFIFFFCSFLITIVFAVYFPSVALYLEHGLDVENRNVAPLTTIGQFAEMLLLPLLPLFLRKWGMKWVIAVGMLGWVVRYALFAVGDPFALVIVGIALHGICFDFFFAAGFIHVENNAPGSIRASAQSLYAFLTYGFAFWIGSETYDWLYARYTSDGATDWHTFFFVLAITATVGLAIFVALFRERRVSEARVVPEAAEGAS